MAELSTDDKIRVVELALELIDNGNEDYMCCALERAIESITPIKNPYLFVDTFLEEIMPEFLETKHYSKYPTETFWYNQHDSRSRIAHLERFLNELKEKRNAEQRN